MLCHCLEEAGLVLLWDDGFFMKRAADDMTALRLIRKLLCSSLLAGQLKLVLPCWGHVDCRDENINLVYRRPDHRGHISDGLRFSSDIDPLRIS